MYKLNINAKHSKTFYLNLIEKLENKIENEKRSSQLRINAIEARMAKFKKPEKSKIYKELVETREKWINNRDSKLAEYKDKINDCYEGLKTAYDDEYYTRDWFRAHREYNHTRNKEYYEKNKEKILKKIKEKGYNNNQVEAKEAKDLCKELANYTCQICGAKNGPMHAHHIIPLPEGTNDQKNLICLCVSCHQKVHKGKLKLFGEDEE